MAYGIAAERSNDVKCLTVKCHTHLARRAATHVVAFITPLAAMVSLERAAAQVQPAPTATAPAAAVSTVQTTRPAVPALLPSPAVALTRIAFGSCLNQSKPQPIWAAVMAAKPELMVLTGDTVYGSTNDDTLDPLAAAYAAQAANAEFRFARERLPMLAIWDDHDFGRNDGGGDYPLKAHAADMFDAFWGPLPDRPASGALYHARTYGPPGRRVQIVLLDTRFFRSRLRPKSPEFVHWGRYEPDPDPTKTVLGDAQWQWLEKQLAETADVRIVVSSIQVLADGHGFERWGNLRAERDRLVGVLARATGRTIIVSGDRHYGALYELALPSAATTSASAIATSSTTALPQERTLVEMTASALNMASGRPAQDAIMVPLVGDLVAVDNFGLASIDWDARTIDLSLRGVEGGVLASRAVAF